MPLNIFLFYSHTCWGISNVVQNSVPYFQLCLNPPYKIYSFFHFHQFQGEIVQFLDWCSSLPLIPKWRQLFQPTVCIRGREELQPNCPLSQRMFSSAPLKGLAIFGTFPLPFIVAILSLPSRTCLDDWKTSCFAVKTG